MNRPSGPATKAYVPLFNFWCAAELFDVAPGVTVQRLETPPPIDKEGMADWDVRKLGEADYWLVLEAPIAAAGFASRMNDWAIALWLTRPTKLRLRYRFETSGDGLPASCTRLHSYFEPNQFDMVDGSYTKAELEFSQRAFSLFQTIDPTSRLGWALSLTAEALWQHRWHAAIVLFSASVETLLAFERGGQLTNRLAKTYAAFTGPAPFDEAMATFKEAYKARSGIVHGRFEMEQPDARLEAVAQWARIARAIWRVIVDQPQIVSTLQHKDNDEERKKFFTALGA